MTEVVRAFIRANIKALPCSITTTQTTHLCSKPVEMFLDRLKYTSYLEDYRSRICVMLTMNLKVDLRIKTNIDKADEV